MYHNGNKVNSQKGMEDVVVAYFNTLFQDPEMNNISSHIQFIQCFHRFVLVKEGQQVRLSFSSKEIEEILKDFC